MTTREPRENEIDGVHYHFVTEESFKENISSDGFLEYAEVYGSLYGTPKKPVIEALDGMKDVILEIDIQGALKVQESFPQGIFIFILPPSLKELENRLRSRRSETEDCIRLRLNEAEKELQYIEQYEYCVINDDLDEAAKNVCAIMRAEHLKVNDYTESIISKMLENK
jgi:guanylate kinase